MTEKTEINSLEKIRLALERHQFPDIMDASAEQAARNERTGIRGQGTGTGIRNCGQPSTTTRYQLTTNN